MSNDYKASLHADLARMAALMRIAKEKEMCGREVQDARDGFLAQLRQECDSWHQESQRLMAQTRGLQKQVSHARGIPWQDSGDEHDNSLFRSSKLEETDKAQFSEEISMSPAGQSVTSFMEPS